MKLFLTSILLTVLISCNYQPDKIKQLQKRIDKLEIKLEDCYKPGFGEMMNSIQMHHLKLWYAGNYNNWKLAKFELKELKEVVEDIEEYQSNRKETKLIGMLNPAIDSLQMAIGNRDTGLFNKSFSGLTNACNACHALTEYEYNAVQIPTENRAFPNQDFKPKQ